jgi:hypothetical protein
MNADYTASNAFAAPAPPRSFLGRMSDRAATVRPRAEELYSTYKERAAVAVAAAPVFISNTMLIVLLFLVILLIMLASYEPLRTAIADLFGEKPAEKPAPPQKPAPKQSAGHATAGAETGQKWCLVSDLDNARRCIPVANASECQSNYVYKSKCACEA